MYQMGLDYNKCITTDTFSVSIISYRNLGCFGFFDVDGYHSTADWIRFGTLFGYWEIMKNNIHAKEDFLHLAKEEMMTGV